MKMVVNKKSSIILTNYEMVITPHQAGYVGELYTSYKELIEGRGMGFTSHLDLTAYSVAVEISKTMTFLKLLTH
jgi:hypothetical protein